MNLRDVPLDVIGESHLANLIAMSVPESKSIEYKLTLPRGSRADKVEFLKDVTSFANTIGGDLVYGIAAKSGLPIAIPGFAGVDLDAEKLRLSSLLQSSIDPRIFGVEMREVPLSSGSFCFIIRVPRSLNGPHAANHDNHWRFWARNASGKYALDVGELRRAFTIGNALANSVRTFRAERLAQIRANEGPVTLLASSALVIHLAPLGAAERSTAIALQNVPNASKEVGASPVSYETGIYSRFNLDGHVTWVGQIDRTKTVAYTQVFRTGAVEIAISDLFEGDSSPKHETWLPLAKYERDVIIRVDQYRRLLRHLSVAPPIFVMITLIGVRGAFVDRPSRRDRLFSYPIDRDGYYSPTHEGRRRPLEGAWDKPYRQGE